MTDRAQRGGEGKKNICRERERLTQAEIKRREDRGIRIPTA